VRSFSWGYDANTLVHFTKEKKTHVGVDLFNLDIMKLILGEYFFLKTS